MDSEGGGLAPRHRWKESGHRGKASSLPGRRIAAAIFLLALACVAAAIAAGILLGPLLSWQTAFVTLVVDEYRLGVLEPVPFAHEDRRAFHEALADSLHSRLGADPVDLTGFESVEGVRDLLLPRMRQLDVRSKDVLLAYVRGQTFVAPPLFDEAGLQQQDSYAGRACLLASDCSIVGPRPREIVPIRDVIEALGAAPSRLTVVALDLGDVEWDPRLGVLGHVVPTALDREFARPQQDANFHNWVIGSHDLFQYSSGSLPARRTCFARAVELALSGAADQGGTGNGNGIIELDELARFVTVWTNEWVRRDSGGRSRQTPVVWKLGVGRVPIEEIPSGLGLLRVPPVGVRGGFSNTSGGPPPAEADQSQPPASSGTATGAPADAATAAPAAPQPPAASTQAPGPSAEVVPSAAPAAPSSPSAAPIPAPLPLPANQPSASLLERPAGSDERDAAGEVRLVAAADEPGGESLAFPGGPRPAAAGPPAAAEEAAPEAVPAPSPVAAAPLAVPAPAKPDTAAAPPTPAGQPPQAATPASPAAPPAPEFPQPLPPRNAWDALSRLGERRLDSTGVDGPQAIQPVPADYAIGAWRRAFTIAEAAESRGDSAGSMTGRDVSAFDALGRGLTRILQADDRTTIEPTGSSAADRLWAARELAAKAGVLRAWSTAPDDFCRVIAERNEALLVAASTIDIVGRASGGAGTPAIDPSRVIELCERIRDVQRLIATGASVVGSERLGSAARAMGSERTVVSDQLDHLLARLLERGGARSDPAISRCRAALRSPVISDDRREAIREALFGASTRGERRPLQASGGPSTIPPGREAIDRVSLDAISSGVRCLVALLEAVTVQRDFGAGQSRSEDVAAIRQDLAALADAGDGTAEAFDRLMRLGGRIAWALERVAETAIASTQRNPGGLLADVEGLPLRVMDVRDIERLDEATVIGLPDWSATGAFGLSLDSPGEEALLFMQPVDVRLAIDSGGMLPPGSFLRFLFDPAAFELRLEDGRPVEPDIALPVEQFAFAGGQLQLQAIARRFAGRPDDASRLEVMWESRQQTSSTATVLKLPANRDVSLVFRNPIPAGGSWNRSQKAEDSATSLQSSVAELTMIPGEVASWTLALRNDAEIPREVTVTLHAISDERSGFSESFVGREVKWERFATALSTGGDVGTPLASLEKVALPVGESPVPLMFPPDSKGPAVTPPPASAETAAANAGGGPSPTLLGSDLALVVRETTPGQPERRWLHRMRLEILHPRSLVQAVATWSASRQTVEITASLQDGWREKGLFPAEGLRLEARPLQDSSGVRVYRGSAVLDADRPTATLLAGWIGSPDQPALVAVDVNGYPRALVFAVECSAARDGQPQQPQFDWRGVAITTPSAETTTLQAPVSKIPVQLQVDAPPDASGLVPVSAGADPAGSLVSVALREVRGGSFFKEPGRVVWWSTTDRKIVHTSEKASPPASIAIGTTVSDWALELSGQGLNDVDGEIEARLAIPGQQAPLLATRRFVFDGRPPRVDAPPTVNAVVGQPLVIPIQVADDPRETYAGQLGRALPGVSGLQTVEWALDLKGDGKPESWQPAVSIGRGLYEVRLDTSKLPVGTRLPLLVRATDRVGLADPPKRIWITTAIEVAKGSIRGRVLLDGRGEAGVRITIDGPGNPPPVTTDASGGFAVPDLDPGDYQLTAGGVVRNKTYASEPRKVTVERPPALSASVTLELK